MQTVTLRAFATAVLVLSAVTSIANAQGTARLRGTVQRMEGPMYVVKLRDGTEAKVALAENGVVVAIVKASLSDIKQGSFVGSTGRRPMEARRQSRFISSPRRCAERAKGTTPGISDHKVR